MASAEEGVRRSTAECFWAEILMGLKKKLSPNSKVEEIRLLQATGTCATVVFETKAGSVRNRAEIFSDRAGKKIVVFHLPSGKTAEVYLDEIIPHNPKSGN